VHSKIKCSMNGGGGGMECAARHVPRPSRPPCSSRIGAAVPQAACPPLPAELDMCARKRPGAKGGREQALPELSNRAAGQRAAFNQHQNSFMKHPQKAPRAHTLSSRSDGKASTPPPSETRMCSGVHHIKQSLVQPNIPSMVGTCVKRKGARKCDWGELVMPKASLFVAVSIP
jgi:hypothetical protein